MRLRIEGHTYSEIGKRLGLSRQRAQQLTQPPLVVRRMVASAACGECQRCGMFLMYRGDVHHRSSKIETPELYNDTANLQYLCKSCHRMAHYDPREHEKCCARRQLQVREADRKKAALLP